MPPTWMEELRDAMSLLEKGQTKMCLTALHAMLQDHGKDDLCRALVFDGMGRALFAENEPKLGMEAFAESLAILRKLFDEGKISADTLLGAMQNQAHAETRSGNLEKALEIGKNAAQFAAKTFGLASPQLAEALFHLSSPYYERKDYDSAERLLLRAKNIWEKAPGAPAEQIGTCLNNIGRIYEERGDLDTGISYHRRAVEFRRAMSNKEDLAFSLGNYGVALGSAGRLAEACDALRECVVVYSAIGLGDSPIAQAFAANLDLFEKALHKEKGNA